MFRGELFTTKTRRTLRLQKFFSLCVLRGLRGSISFVWLLLTSGWMKARLRLLPLPQLAGKLGMADMLAEML
jgi:hypothetical protein